MRYVGRITEWNDDRGFGFVRADGVKDKAFVHINAFDCAVTRPRTGTLISYHLLGDRQSGFNATGIRVVEDATDIRVVEDATDIRVVEDATDIRVVAPKRNHRPVRRISPGKIIAVLFFAALATGVFAAKVPLPVALAYAFMSVVAVQLYGIDKSAALNNQWRIPEATLHFMGLAGGWPGALFAQAAFRHKTNKASFQAVFWLTVMVNCAALTWLIAQGSNLEVPLDLGRPIDLGLPPARTTPVEPGLPTITPLGQ